MSASPFVTGPCPTYIAGQGTGYFDAAGFVVLCADPCHRCGKPLRLHENALREAYSASGPFLVAQPEVELASALQARRDAFVGRHQALTRAEVVNRELRWYPACKCGCIEPGDSPWFHDREDALEMANDLIAEGEHGPNG